MTLTPQDIQTQQFHVRFRGFDIDEVDSFLEKVAEQVLALTEENKVLKTKLAEIAKEVASYHSQEKTFQNAILSAQNIAEEMKEKSKQEAEVMLAKALEDAKLIREEAGAEAEKLEQDIERLKDLKHQVKDDLRQFLQNYLDQIDRMPESAGFASVQSFSTPKPVPEAENVEIEDLYEKIELPNDFLGTEPATPAANAEPEEAGDTSEEDSRMLAMEDGQEEEAEAAELDDDFVFTLEDPLDENEPSVSFDEEDEEPFGKRQGVGS